MSLAMTRFEPTTSPTPNECTTCYDTVVGLVHSKQRQNLEYILFSHLGIPGIDYPIYSSVPPTSFLCDGQVEGGYYADVEAECQD